MGWEDGTYGRRGAHRILVVYLRERDHLDDPDVDGRIILRWIFKKWNGLSWTVLISLKIGIES